MKRWKKLIGMGLAVLLSLQNICYVNAQEDAWVMQESENSETDISLDVGKKVEVEVPYYENSYEIVNGVEPVVFYSSNENVATLRKTGVAMGSNGSKIYVDILAVGEGNCDVTVYMRETGQVLASYTITVNPMKEEELDLCIGEKTNFVFEYSTKTYTYDFGEADVKSIMHEQSTSQSSFNGNYNSKTEVIMSFQTIGKYTLYFYDENHHLIKQAALNVSDHVSSAEAVVGKEPTCTEDGYKAFYCVKCDTQIETEPIPATGHAYGEAQFEWSENFETCEATFYCGNERCPEAVVTVPCTVSVDRHDASCTESGEVTCLAVCTAPDGEEVSDEQNIEVPAVGHDYENPRFMWSADKTCTASFTCVKCGNLIDNQTCEVTSETTEATCTEEGRTIYTATVEMEGTTYTNVIEEWMPATGHDYKDGFCTVCGEEEPSKILEVSGGRWYHDSTGWWYTLKEGGYLKDCKAKIDGSVYLFKTNGYMVTGWIYEDGGWYYYKPSGAMAVGWVLVSGKWYYMTDKGIMVTGKQDINGTVYYFNTSGTMITGWRCENGNWYYHNASGLMEKGWLQLGLTWYYLDPATYVMVTGTQVIGNATYRFTTSGAMITGWVREGGVWYYHTASGYMAKGWAKDGSLWYYFDKNDGRMYANQWLDGTYYLKSSGAMAVGWTFIDGDYYYFNDGGVKVCNQWVGDYYLKADGTMAANEWIGDYYVGADGKWIPSSSGVSGTVYWTPGGKSYHSSPNCTSLKRSKDIRSGSLSDAYANGKNDPCNLCVR